MTISTVLRLTETTRRSKFSQLRKAALEKRLESNDRYRDARTLLGALLFNHLISAVDARFAARSGGSVSARLLPDGSSALTFRASF